ncbi:TetR/AcrR family transcriptional regulator [Bosea sp. 47.2.35]|uniref:TetR/AcrR family transcriptional regulator n=1 Tax=Bosea sp. 47.2.35 TaxID=2969304 RepID=UPI00214FC88E|nr:TetR/AcrR family transcriptional regulator [Bosea sp. 47.2.35]MCR4521294.1 TetR/AcrR family transcriptional regulator [Bosea sp. 47.2.35]
MRDESKAERQREIEAVAYRLIRDRGYGGVSMLAIAKEAKASNETLYRWYGNKRGLLTAMVERNAQATADMLRAAIEDGADAIATLERIAPILLSMLLGEKAILLNRAAASDETGELGAAINLAGRSAVFPLIETLIAGGMATGGRDAPSARVATEWFLCLLIGDQQIRRVTRALEQPSEVEIGVRVASALSAFRKLCGPSALV